MKFFQKIRQKLMAENKTTHYLKYAIGEIILVVIGILIALQINNRNQDRLERIEEKKILLEIKNALEEDLSDRFDFHIRETTSDINSMVVIHEHMTQDIPYHDSISLYFPLISRVGWRFWSPQMSPFESLKSKGVDIIKNDSLRSAILQLYNTDYVAIAEYLDNYVSNIKEYGRPLARTLFQFNDDVFTGNNEVLKLVPLDYEALKENTAFRNIIIVMQLNNLEHLENLVAYKPKVEKVIQQIERELEK